MKYIRFFSSKHRIRYASRDEEMRSELKAEMKKIDFIKKTNQRRLKKVKSIVPSELVATEVVEETTSTTFLFREDKIMYKLFGRKTLEHFNDLPLQSFPGKVSIITTEAEDIATSHLLEKELIIGIDTESKPSFRKGQRNPMCLMQISTSTNAFLYPLSRSQSLPKGLAQVLANPHVLKVGQAVDNDIQLITTRFEYRNDPICSLVDVERVAKNLGFRKTALRTLCKVLLGFDISKDQQRSNWEAKVLCPKQTIYAATDAWAPRQTLCSLEADAIPAIQVWDYPSQKTRSSYFDPITTFHTMKLAKTQDAMFIKEKST